MSSKSHQGISLIELLVVVALITVLAALILPAIQSAREASRNVTCSNNLRQLGIAIHNYESANRVYPPSFIFSLRGSWSVHGRLLPFLEQTVAANRIRLDLEWYDPINLATGVQVLEIPQFRCPSDPNSHLLYDAGPSEGYVRPLNYGFNCGTWFVFDPKTRSYGDGCFHPNARIGASSIADGLTNTLCTAEVKTFQSYFRNTIHPGETPPTNPLDLARLAGGAQFELGPTLNQNGGHTEWCDGPVHESGFTTVFAPNSFVKYLHSDGRTYDADFNSRYEGTSLTMPTYAAITARSFHSGRSNVVMMDGSVHSKSDGIALVVWRGLGTRAGAENLSAE